MSSISVNRSVPLASLSSPAPSQSSRQVRQPVQTAPSRPSGPSVQMQQQVQSSQAQTQSSAQLTSPQTVSQASQQIQQASPSLLSATLTACLDTVGQTEFGKKCQSLASSPTGQALSTAASYTGKGAATVLNFAAKAATATVAPTLVTQADGSFKEDDDNPVFANTTLQKAYTEVNKIVKNGDDSLAQGIEEFGKGIESFKPVADFVKSSGENLEMATDVLKAVHELSATSDISEQAAIVANVAFKPAVEALGAKSTVDLCEKASKFYAEPSFKSATDVVGAIKEFTEDESLLAQTEMMALSYIGSAASTVASSAGLSFSSVADYVPGLNVCSAALAAGDLCSTAYQLYTQTTPSSAPSGPPSTGSTGPAPTQPEPITGKDVAKKAVTLAGTVAVVALGAPVAIPVAAAINYALDHSERIKQISSDTISYSTSAISSAYTSVSNWWYGSNP